MNHPLTLSHSLHQLEKDFWHQPSLQAAAVRSGESCLGSAVVCPAWFSVSLSTTGWWWMLLKDAKQRAAPRSVGTGLHSNKVWRKLLPSPLWWLASALEYERWIDGCCNFIRTEAAGVDLRGGNSAADPYKRMGLGPLKGPRGLKQWLQRNQTVGF